MKKTLLFIVLVIIYYPFNTVAQLKSIYKFSDNKTKITFSTDLNGKYCFLANSKLWIYDEVKQEPLALTEVINSQYLLNVNGVLFFVVYDEKTDFQTLWKTDGTKSGTIALKMIQKGNTLPNTNYGYSPLININGITFFLTRDDNNNNQLWRSDGSPQGTYVVTADVYIEEFIPFRGKALFMLRRNNNESELWLSDGTSNGTQKIVEANEIFSKEKLQGLYLKRDIIVANDFLYFIKSDPDHKLHLWQSDATLAGTSKVGGDSSDEIPARAEYFFPWKNQIFFGVDTFEYVRFWKVDISTGQVSVVKDFGQQTGYQFFNYIALQDKFLFYMPHNQYGLELWVSDGTPENTRLLKDIYKGRHSGLMPNEVSFNLGDFEQIDNYLYFPASDGVFGFELWRTDGTPENTHIVNDIAKGVKEAFDSDNPDNQRLKNINGKLVFQAKNEKNEPFIYQYQPEENLSNPDTPHTWRTDEWYQTIGTMPRLSSTGFSYNEDLAVDKENNIYVSGSYNNKYSGLIFFDNDYIMPTNPKIQNGSEGSYFAKFDKKGNLQWAKSIGEAMYSTSPTKLATDNEGFVYLSSSFYKDAVVDNWEIHNANGGMYLAKYDTQGKQIWLSSAHFSTKGVIFKIIADAQNNIYVAGYYEGNSANFGNGITLQSDSSPRFFIAKYDKNGKILWAKNLDHIGNWYGKIADLKLDKNQNLYSLMSQGTANVSSTCKAAQWRIKLECINPQGTIKWTKIFEGDDLNMANSLDISPLGEVFLVGNFRGTFSIDDHNLQTDAIGTCNLTTSFMIRLNSQNGKVIQVKSNNPYVINPSQILFNADNTYFLIGMKFNARDENIEYNPWSSYPDNQRQIFIHKYDYYGRLLQERTFNTNNVFWRSHNPKMLIDSENYLILSDIVKGRLDTLPNAVINENDNTFLMRLKNDPLTYKNYEIQNEDIITIAPNPTLGSVIIKTKQPEWLKYEVQIINALGQNIRQFNKNDEFDVLPLDLSGLASGIYILIFDNGIQKITKRVIKH